MANNEVLNFDSANFITVNNQNLEEEEELEDRKRREHEIHNFLTNALDDYNYDDESTINSSVASQLDIPDYNYDGGGGVNKSDHERETYLNSEYTEASLNDQIKVLYEVRTREVATLNKKLEELTAALNQREQISKKKVTLLEIENERKNISLKEAQGLLADKVEQIKQLEADLESCKRTVNNLEANITEINEEKAVLHELNVNFERQLAMMDRGFPLLQNKVDKELLESQRGKIAQLEHSLTETIEQGNFKDQKIRELKQTIESDANRIRENELFIRELTEKLENSHKRIKELHNDMEALKERNSKQSDNSLSEELRRIRQHNETNDNLCETVRKVITEEFRDKIVGLDLDNQTLKSTIVTREQELKQTKEEYGMLRKRYEELTSELSSVKTENQTLQDKIQDFNRCVSEKAAQTSFNLQDKEQKNDQNLKKINDLENELEKMQQENAQLKVKVGLEREREFLIKKLQEKAVEFERMIYEKQKPNLTSVAINTTEPYPEVDKSADNSLLKVKYDALLYQSEVNIRKELKKEFESKLEKILQQHKEDCKDCVELRKQIEQLNSAREVDRMAVVNMIKVWEEKFLEAEKENQEKFVQFTTLKDAHNDKLDLFMRKLQEEYEMKREKMQKQLNSVQTVLESRKNKLVGRVNRIQMKIQEGDDEVRVIERRYLNEKSRIEKR